MSPTYRIRSHLKQQIRRHVVPWLLDKDLLLTRTVSRQAIADFLQRVHPVQTEHGLVRIGAPGDGGYLVPDDLQGIRHCFSPGVSEVADFELALAERGVKCFLADFSVEAPPRQHASFVFDKKFLGLEDDEVFIRMESWVRYAPADDGDMVLQMDIEGAEYATLLDTSDETLRRFRLIVVEFHELQGLTDRIGHELIRLTFHKLLRHFDIVHIHPNNARRPVSYEGLVIPPVMEFSFLRRDRVHSRQPASMFPHPLDRRNMPSMEDIALPKCWYA
jgi:hypothetical protein